jgi:hypothetical protein
MKNKIIIVLTTSLNPTASPQSIKVIPRAIMAGQYPALGKCSGKGLCQPLGIFPLAGLVLGV